VPVKLILMAYKNNVVNNTIQQKLEEIRSTVQRPGDAHAPLHTRQPIGHDRPMFNIADQPGG
jgi:hypothetical protein